MNCKICSMPSNQFSTAELRRRYAVTFFRCESCGFIQTEEPYWLNAAYSDAINPTDVGIISRNIMLATITKAVIFALFDGKKSFLDYGGGYGLLVRMMRDFGFDFYRYDKHCENLFARYFDGNVEGKVGYEVVTAFEVFEHLVDPLADINTMLQFSPNILFTTEIVPIEAPKPGSWQYYGLEHGQHVSFYTNQALSIIAARNHLNLYTDGRYIHLLTNRRMSPTLFHVVSRYKIASFLNLFIRRNSLLQQDYQKSLEIWKNDEGRQSE
jgi:hypothetical protein